jgi:hypothetical protein
MKRGIQVLLVMFALACGGGNGTAYKDAGDAASQVDGATEGGSGTGGSGGSGGSGGITAFDAGAEVDASATDAEADTSTTDAEADASDATDAATEVDAAKDAEVDSGVACDPTGSCSITIVNRFHICDSVSYDLDAPATISIVVSKTTITGFDNRVNTVVFESCATTFVESNVLGNPGDKIVTLQFDGNTVTGEADWKYSTPSRKNCIRNYKIDGSCW